MKVSDAHIEKILAEIFRRCAIGGEGHYLYQIGADFGLTGQEVQQLYFQWLSANKPPWSPKPMPRDIDRKNDARPHISKEEWEKAYNAICEGATYAAAAKVVENKISRAAIGVRFHKRMGIKRVRMYYAFFDCERAVAIMHKIQVDFPLYEDQVWTPERQYAEDLEARQAHDGSNVGADKSGQS